MSQGPYQPTNVPDLLAKAPPWFNWAVSRPVESRTVHAAGCPIHYLYWPEDESSSEVPGVLLLHGGGAHANWWRFIAPYFTREYRVAAMDLSGMGDSGTRDSYSADVRAAEIQAVFEDAGFCEAGRPLPFIVGHSFGGLTAMRYASLHGERLGGFLIAESPIRPPDAERKHFASRTPDVEEMRRYASFDEARVRFRLRPRQECANDFIVEFIGRHSIRQLQDGAFSWKFDPPALSRDRHTEPFRDYLSAITCRRAFVFGEKSALCTSDVVEYTAKLMGPEAPIVGIPESQHHLILDEPLAFVSAARAILACWMSA